MKVNQLIKKLRIQNDEIIRFVIVGGIAVIIDGIVYVLMVRFLMIDHSISKRLSFIFGSIWAFLANKHFTFRSSAPVGREMIIFSALYITTYLVNGWVHDITWEASSIDWLSFLIATTTSTIINFVGQKFIVFKKSS